MAVLIPRGFIFDFAIHAACAMRQYSAYKDMKMYKSQKLLKAFVVIDEMGNLKNPIIKILVRVLFPNHEIYADFMF